jgi:DnaJ-class molecular chaperone
MAFESKHVVCEYCEGNGITYVPSLTPAGDVEVESISCAGCDGTGVMEIRKTEKSDWTSCCQNCGGKGFSDVWNALYEEHDTVDCAACNATGGIPYSPELTQ